MNLKSIRTGMCLLAGAVVMPIALLASTPRACVAGKPTPASYAWNFPQEASRLLDGIQMDAASVKNHADRLEVFSMDQNIDWRVHGDVLNGIQSKVDDMGRKLCRLEMIRRVSTPQERKAIDQTASLVRLMADNTDDAINFLNARQANFWEPSYREYVGNLYRESGQVLHSVKTFEQSAKIHGVGRT